MKERLASFLESLKGFWNRTSKRMRVVYLSGAVAVLGVSLVVVLLINRTDDVVLVDNISAADAGAIIATLNEMNVIYTFDGNRIMIPRGSENHVRMELATRNFPSSGFDYEVFRQGTGITATQFERERWALFQQQERLQAAIMTFPEVRNAIVTISVPERNSFVLASQNVDPTASILVETAMGRSLTPQQIQGIINIVTFSVPGLTEDNVTMADQHGDLRSVLLGNQQDTGNILQLTEQVNETVRRRIMTMLVPVYGDDRVRVAVSSVLDTDNRVTESIQFTPLDPDNPTNNPLDYMEIIRERVGGDGFAMGIPGAELNVDVPGYAAFDDVMADADHFFVHDVYDFLVGSVREQIISDGLAITGMSVAVFIDAVQLPPGERDMIVDIVAATAGVSADQVAVQNVAFAREDIITPPLVSDNMQLIVIISLAILALLIIAAIIITTIMKRRKAAALAAAGAMGDDALLDLFGESEEEEFEPITIPDSPENKLKNQIRDLAQSDPEIVAGLIKTWLNGTKG